jgi:hypothetical protein
MSNQNQAERLRESVVTECLEALDWEGLKRHLDSFVLDERGAKKLVELVMRARSLVFRYPGKLKKRTAILDGVIGKIRADVDDEAADHARKRFDLFALIDQGYSGLRGFIEKLPLAPLPPIASFSAYLAFVARDWNLLQDQIKAASAAERISGTVVVTNADGDRFGADAATSQLVNLLTMNVTLLAYRGKWFDDDDIVRVPELAAVTDEQINQAGAANFTALAWKQWQLVEERTRFLDGDLERIAAPAEGFPEGAEIMAHKSDSLAWEMFDLAANERLGDRLRQTFQDMALKTDLLSKGQGIDPGAPMPPTGYVSSAELHSVVMLSEYLGLNVATHPADLGGLTLSEWIRGFAVLQQLADRHDSGADALERSFPRLDLAELEAILDRNGLTGAKARIFIDHASFTRSSRDLYDAPILRGSGEWCWIAAPALMGALIIRLVLSTLSNKEIVIKGKGEAFEDQFRKELRDQGLSVYHFEAHRPGGPFEYDALVPWGDYLFVFECKNRSISDTNPIASYNLLRSAVGHVEQITRLVDALRDHPDILTEFVAEDCSKRKVVPVVMSAMPFAMKGDLGGVYFADAASTGRFFQERYMHISRLHQVGEIRVLHRIRTHDQWSGDTPSADDFMGHIQYPLPLQIMIAHLHVGKFVFQIGDNLFAATQMPRRGEMTIATMAEVAGLTEAQIKAEMERVEREAIEPARAAVKADANEEEE